MPDDLQQGSLFPEEPKEPEENHPLENRLPRNPDGEWNQNSTDLPGGEDGESPEDVDSESFEEMGDCEDSNPEEEEWAGPATIPVEPRIISETEQAKLTAREMNLGAVIAAAIGDAMGHPTEFLTSFDQIYQKYGSEGVRGYELYWEQDDGRIYAPYTDDTQMAELVLRTLLEEKEDLNSAMQKMAEKFVVWSVNPQGGHRAPGNACLSGCRRLSEGVPWNEAGETHAGGCGSVMRAYPFGLIFANDLEKAEFWSVQHSKLTHRDPIALAACAAMAVGMGLIRQKKPVDYVVSEMVAAACRYCGKTAAMMATAIHEARTGVSPRVTLSRLEGWAAHEAIAAAVYIFCRHPNDPVSAILEGANTPGDSDSIATLTGAMVGCRCGFDSLPKLWVEDLERTTELQKLAQQISEVD